MKESFQKRDLLSVVKRKVVKFGQSIHLGDFRIEFIRTNHSIADAAALAIHTPVGVIVHTGDFKVDYTPVFGDAINLCRFSELGKKGVLALMCDSTNVLRPGFTPSERKVGKTFDHIFQKILKAELLLPHLHLMWTEYSRLLTQPANITERL